MQLSSFSTIKLVVRDKRDPRIAVKWQLGFNAKRNYIVSQNVTILACYNFNVHQPILIIFGRNVAKKVNIQMIPPRLTSAIALPGKIRKHENRIFSLKCCLRNIASSVLMNELHSSLDN